MRYLDTTLFNRTVICAQNLPVVHLVKYEIRQLNYSSTDQVCGSSRSPPNIAIISTKVGETLLGKFPWRPSPFRILRNFSISRKVPRSHSAYACRRTVRCQVTHFLGRPSGREKFHFQRNPYSERISGDGQSFPFLHSTRGILSRR